MKATSSRKTAAARNGNAKRHIVRTALRFVGEHPKAAATALAAGVGAYALVYRGTKAVKKAAGKVADATDRAAAKAAHVADKVAGRTAKVGRRRATRPALRTSTKR